MRSACVFALFLLAFVSVAVARAAEPSTADQFASSPIADWTKIPAPTQEVAFEAPVPQRLQLDNGMALLVVENHELPIVSMLLVAPGAGAASDPAGKFGVAAFTADLLDEGAGGLSAIAISDETERLGAGIGVHVDSDAAYVSIGTLAKTLDETIDLATKVIMQPAFDEQEAERVKGDRVTALELRRDRPREVAEIMLNAALYGADSAYGHPSTGYHEQFTTVTVADARAFYEAQWNPCVMTLVVSGDVSATELHRKLNAGLGGWQPKGVTASSATTTAVAAQTTNRLLLVDRRDAVQSDVYIGIVGLDRNDSRYAQFEVFRTAFGGGFTSRLTQRLREQLGIVYHAAAVADWRLAKGPFYVSTAIETGATGQGVTEILAILDDLASTALPTEELDKAKLNIVRGLPAYFDTNADTTQAFAELALHGLPDNWYNTYAASVRGVNAEQVKTVAKDVAPSAHFLISIVGDVTKIKPGLDKLNLGKPQLHNGYGVPLK